MARRKYLTLAEFGLVFGVIGAITGGASWILITVVYGVDMAQTLPQFDDGQTWRLSYFWLFVGMFTFTALLLWLMYYIIFIPWHEWHDSKQGQDTSSTPVMGCQP